MSEDDDYAAAKDDPVAALVLDALHQQDARTYNGNGGNTGRLALDTAAQIAALASDETVRLRRELEFLEALCDGGEILVNGVPWREMFERLNAIVSDPVASR